MKLNHLHSNYYLPIMLLIFSSLPLHAKGIPKPLVIVDPVVESEDMQIQKSIGRVISLQSGMISTDISGIISEVHVKEGQIVEKSTPIATLDKQRLELELQLAEAKFKTSQANQQAIAVELEQAEKNLARQVALKDTPAFSKALYEDLENAKQNAISKLSASKAETSEKHADLMLAKLNVERAVIQAPFSGLISQKLVHPGSYITPGTNIIELININNLEIAIDIPREQITAIQDIKEYSVLLSEQAFKTTFARKILSENEASRTISLRLTPSSALLPKLIVNQSITVLVPINQLKKTLTIHKDALLYRKNSYLVFVVQDNQAKAQPIKIGQAIGNRIEILDNLKVGDLIVVRGNERLQPNQKVNYQLLEVEHELN